MGKDRPNSDTPPNFWTTLPGIITAIATLITAVVGGIVLLKPGTPSNQNGSQLSATPTVSQTPQASPSVTNVSASATADGSTYTVTSAHLAAYSANESLLTLTVKVSCGDTGISFTPEMFRLEIDGLKITPQSTLSGRWVESHSDWKEDVKFIFPNTVNSLTLIVGYAGSSRTARIPLSKDAFPRNP